jgi:hypothetical protein
MIQEITENSDRAKCDPQKGIPELFAEEAMTFGVVHHAEREYFEGDKAH